MGCCEIHPCGSEDIKKLRFEITKEVGAITMGETLEEQQRWQDEVNTSTGFLDLAITIRPSPSSPPLTVLSLATILFRSGGI